MDMRTTDRAFEHGPEGFQRVDVGIAVRPLPASVIDCGVFVSEAGKDTVGQPFIRTNARSLGDLSLNVRDQRLAGSITNNTGRFARVNRSWVRGTRSRLLPTGDINTPYAPSVGWTSFVKTRRFSGRASVKLSLLRAPILLRICTRSPVPERLWTRSWGGGSHRRAYCAAQTIVD